MTEMIITSSVLILVIVAVRYLLKGELSVRVQYALWLPVAARLLVPGTFLASTFSVLNVTPTVELPDRGNIYLSGQGITARQPPPQTGWSLDRSTEYGIYYAPQENEYSFFPTDEPLPDWAANYTTVPASHILPTPKAALTAIWYIGMAAMGGWFLWVNLSFRKRLRAERRRVEVPDCPLPVYVAEGIPSPCLAGLFRPAVYVTPACLEDGDRLRHVLAHELAHRRHRDPFWSLVRCVCLTVYWFHPLVWLAASLSRRDCELACDEAALKELGEEERTAYGRTLIGLIEVSASPVRLLQTATTMADRRGGVKERLLFIAKKPRVVALTGVVAVLIAAIAAACTFTGAAEPSADYATVEEALADMPERLRSEPEGLGGITAYTPEDSSDFFTLEEGELLRGYWKVYLYLSSNLHDPLGWMGSVYRMDQAGYDQLVEAQGLMGRTLNSYWECFAKDSDFYYLIYAPLTAPEMKTGLTEGAELQAELIAWMKEAVLSAQGMAPVDTARFNYTYSAAGLSPAELEWLNEEYFRNIQLSDWPSGADVTVIGGYHGSDGLLHVEYRLQDGEFFGWAALRPDGDGYVLVSNLYPTFKTSVDDPNNSGGFTGRAQDAFILLLDGDNSLLADGPEARAWIDYGYDHSQLNTELGFVYMDVDGDGVIELYLQNTLGPEVLNAVFDYRDGAIRCWRFDIMDGSEFQYMLTDGTMVYECHFSDMVSYDIFRYTPDGEREDLGSLAYTPAGGFSGDNGEPAFWQVDGQPVGEAEFDRVLAERITGKLLTGYYEQWELDRLRGSISVGPGDPDWPADPTPKALAWTLLQKYLDAYTLVSPDSRFFLDSAEVIYVSVFDMDDLFDPAALCFRWTAALGGKNLDDMGGWQAGSGMEYQTEGPYTGKWLQSIEGMAQKVGERWYFRGVGGGCFVDDEKFIPDLDSCHDNDLMDFLLNVADGAYTEAALYELGERFLARPGGILNTMTWYRGVEATRWPDFDGDGADWLVSALVSEFKVMRGGAEDAAQFLAVLEAFAEDDYGGMVRSVREAWDSYVQP